jgi:uncharacterized RDD family membrane protein YckC
MVPVLMHLRIRPRGKRGFSLWLPVILVWIILWALMIVLFPLVLLAGLLSWRPGPGPRLLILYPLVFSAVWNLAGLHIETRDKENEVLISFR